MASVRDKMAAQAEKFKAKDEAAATSLQAANDDAAQQIKQLEEKIESITNQSQEAAAKSQKEVEELEASNDSLETSLTELRSKVNEQDEALEAIRLELRAAQDAKREAVDSAATTAEEVADKHAAELTAAEEKLNAVEKDLAAHKEQISDLEAQVSHTRTAGVALAWVLRHDRWVCSMPALVFLFSLAFRLPRKTANSLSSKSKQRQRWNAAKQRYLRCKSPRVNR